MRMGFIVMNLPGSISVSTKRLFAASLFAIAGVCAPAVASAQEKQTSAADLAAPAPLIQFKDVPSTRVGVDLSNVHQLTLHDAISMAVRRNLDIEFTRFNTETAKYDLFGARGAYDPLISGEVSFLSATDPVTSTFGGGGVD